MKTVAIVTPKIDTFTNPTLIALIEGLIERNVKILFFGFEQIFIPRHIRDKLEISELPFNFYKFESSPKNLKKLAFQYVDIFNKLKIKNKVEYLICVDPMGLVIAGRMKKLVNVKIIYASFEIFFDDEFFIQRKKVVKELEMKYSGDVDTVLIQDKWREKLLRDVNAFSDKTKFLRIPVSPLPLDTNGIVKKDIRAELGIPQGKKIVVYSGSLQGWSGINEMLELFPNNWNNDYWLLIHSHHKVSEDDRISIAVKNLSKAGAQIILHDVPIYDYQEYIEFLSGCDVGLATYFPNPLDIFAGKNIQVIGLSSGKFSTYMLIGLPTITTNHLTYSELIKSYKFGAIIDTAEDIPEALKSISHENGLSENCRRLYKEVLDPTDKINSLIAYIEKSDS